MIMALCGSIGIGVDSFLKWQGVFLFDPEPQVFVIPLWLVGLWLGFAGTLRHGLNYFVKRPALAALAGAIFAPLTYFAAARLGAVSFPLPGATTVWIIGAVWAVMMVCFSGIYHWIEQQYQKNPPATSSQLFIE